MNKDFDLKKDPQYGYDSVKLRARIDQSTKHLYDDTEELDIPSSKTMPLIPVTSTGKAHKYLHNKSLRAY